LNRVSVQKVLNSGEENVRKLLPRMRQGKILDKAAAGLYAASASQQSTILPPGEN
jgi:hypothetical protein